MIGDDGLPVGGYQSAAAQSREKERDEAVIVRPHDRFGFAGENSFQLVCRQRYVEHLDVIDSYSEISNLFVGQYRIERILRFRNGRRGNRSRLLRRFRQGCFPLPQVSGITFSDNNVYDSREIRQFGIIGRVVPLISGIVERGYGECEVLSLFIGIQRLEESALPKKRRFGVAEPQVGQYGVVQIQLGQLVGNPVILQPFHLLHLLRIETGGFHGQPLSQYAISMLDATIEYLLQLVELRFQLQTFHNPSCFIRRYEEFWRKRDNRNEDNIIDFIVRIVTERRTSIFQVPKSRFLRSNTYSLPFSGGQLLPETSYESRFSRYSIRLNIVSIPPP